LAFEEREVVMPTHMALRRIIISETNEEQILELREVDGDRRFSIVIGIFEAISIEKRVKRVESPRPLTHDLCLNVIEELGGELQDVIINDLREQTYFAQLRIRIGAELTPVDCRPSDAIALAVTNDVPIYVAEDVLSESEY
jgi:uncharacterized protein